MNCGCTITTLLVGGFFGLLFALPWETQDILNKYTTIIELSPCLKNISDSSNLSLEEQLESEEFKEELINNCPGLECLNYNDIEQDWNYDKQTKMLGYIVLILTLVLALIYFVADNEEMFCSKKQENNLKEISELQKRKQDDLEKIHQDFDKINKDLNEIKIDLNEINKNFSNKPEIN